MARSWRGTMSTSGPLPILPRVATEGFVLGVDASAEMLEIAGKHAAEAGLRNAAFEQGDTQVHAFPAAGFDLCISRFGVMFFADPEATFENLGRAMLPGGRLVWMVWQSRKNNSEWSTAIGQALGLDDPIPTEAAAAFSLGDPAIVTEQSSVALVKLSTSRETDKKRKEKQWRNRLDLNR